MAADTQTGPAAPALAGSHPAMIQWPDFAGKPVTLADMGPLKGPGGPSRRAGPARADAPRRWKATTTARPTVRTLTQTDGSVTYDGFG